METKSQSGYVARFSKVRLIAITISRVFGKSAGGKYAWRPATVTSAPTRSERHRPPLFALLVIVAERTIAAVGKSTKLRVIARSDSSDNFPVSFPFRVGRRVGRSRYRGR